MGARPVPDRIIPAKAQMRLVIGLVSDVVLPEAALPEAALGAHPMACAALARRKAA